MDKIKLKKTGEFWLRVFSVIRILCLLTMAVAPLFWMWVTWQLALKIFITALLIFAIYTFIYKVLRRVLMQELAKTPMKIIYLAHPISGDIENNLSKIRAIVKEINLSDKTVVPLCPYYVDIVAMDDNVPAERERGIMNDIAILESGIIKEVWLYGDRISTGMLAEVELATKLNIPIVPKTQETATEIANISIRKAERNIY